MQIEKKGCYNCRNSHACSEIKEFECKEDDYCRWMPDYSINNSINKVTKDMEKEVFTKGKKEMKALFRGFCRNENGKETIKVSNGYMVGINGEIDCRKEVKGDWVYGSYCHHDNIVDGDKDDCDFIIEKHIGQYIPFREVISETVCEAVRGFIDVNGKQVFRGDIVKKILDGMIGEVIYTYEFAYKIKKQDGTEIWIGANDYYTWEVIGTKWDKGE